ncbi:MAG TPA: glycine cleavage T C-terminal barrel domain-containing protein [Pirellulales bacterium]|nr:glycine cleavage T C-terminal barrel domain-containing protein [Pirellulales bacterium]
MSPTIENDEQALAEGAGLLDFSDRTRIEVLGDDRASFLHNLSTNDVKKLQPGQGCEAFFLDARGHVKGHVFFICRPGSIVIETTGGQGGPLIAHLDRYLIREKVELADRTDSWGELFLAGANSQDVLGQLTQATMPDAPLANVEIEIAGQAVTLIRVAMTTAKGYILLCTRLAQPAIAEALISAGARLCDRMAFEAARVESRFPLYGLDITDKTLPQEVARDELAISFRKGCYLGQETVARIDALGHVNKKLVVLRFAAAEVPPPGTDLKAGEQVVGQVTSAAFSPRLGGPLALAYVRREHDAAGSKVTSDFGEAVVLEG